MTQSLADQVAELENRVAELERENDILRSERDDGVDDEADDDDEPSPVQESEFVELLRELRDHFKPSAPGGLREWEAHLDLLLHRADQLIEEYDVR